MDSRKTNPNLDEAIRAMREDSPSTEESLAATSRVFKSLNAEPANLVPDRLRGEQDFAALLQPYLRNELSDAQRMLVEDRVATDPAYRRQLDNLRGNVRSMPPARRQRSMTRSVLPWAIAAAMILTTGYLTLDTLDRLMAPAGPRAEIASLNGEIFKVSAAGLEAIKPGSPLSEGEAIRTAKGSAAVVRLPDGSLIEMDERAELSISAAYTGSTIRLERGKILVQAAKQRKGSLKVATRESTVSVKGTIFTVAAGLRGTQVAVVEGNVLVAQAGQTESLLPGQITASQPMLRRTTVSEQVAWSKDSARYLSMLGELSQIRQQIEALPLPALRHSSNLMELLPADTVVYAAIPNISGTVADATKIFEERLSQSPVLREWWGSQQVAEIRNLAEQLRSAGSQIGDEIVIAASLVPGKGIGHPVLLAEVKGASSRTALESQLRSFNADARMASHFRLTDTLLIAGEKPETGSGFAGTALAANLSKSYASGAGWLLGIDMEQILGASVSSVNNMQQQRVMSLTGINQLRHLVVESREIAGRSNASAAVSFSAPRAGIASWLAAPAPMPSLDYISPDAVIAVSAVTKNARQMAEDFFSALPQAGAVISEVEKQIGVNLLDDLAGPVGGEVTLALDGALVPVPAYVLAAEVYDAARLTATLRRLAQNEITLTETTENGRAWYTLKHSRLSTQIHFTYDAGYMVGAPTRDAIVKALQNRTTLLSLPRSQRFRDLLPADAQVNASGVLYANLGSSLSAIAGVINGSTKLSEAEKKTIENLSTNSGPVLITAYAGPDSITVTSSTGFFGFGLDTLLAAGSGTPMLPQILAGVVGQTSNIKRPPIQ